MKHDAFRYEFTGKELIYFFFRKKTCPRCGGKLSKTKDYKTVDGHLLNNTQNAFFVSNAKVKCYHHVFVCPSCKAAYPISELANKRGD